MGLLISKFLFFRKESRVLLLGLDAAGKTTTLYKLKLNEYVTSVPTIGFNVETIQYGGMNMVVWDVGGQDRIRILWKHYFENADALIFMIDTTDVDRISQASDELYKIYCDATLRKSLKCILIYLNKVDIEQSLPTKEVLQRLDMNRYRDVKWHAQPCSALQNIGLGEGLEQLVGMLMNKS